MKNFINTIKKNVNGAIISLTTKSTENRGDFIMDHSAVAIIVIVVAGILLIWGRDYLTNTFLPMLTNSLSDLFSF